MLPFYVDKLFRTDLEGTALPQRQGLKLVFHIPQEDQNLFEADVQEVLIAWNDLELIELKRKLFTATLYLTVKSDDSFPRQLKPKDNRLELSIRRRDKGKLDRFERPRQLAGRRGSG